jgi:alpha-tubulin suppressor-like RCC1 family protein
VVAISAGAYHSLAVQRDGTVWAWGWNAFGQLGDGTTTDRHAPVQVARIAGVTAIAAGGFHSVALVTLGVLTPTVWAWGWNGLGQLGDGTTTDRLVPVPVATPPGGGIGAIAAGTYHSMMLFVDGSIGAWGWNAYGQLGDGTTVDRHVPTLIRSASGFVAVSGGGLHSLGVKPDGSVWAWGWNGVGQVGDGTTVDRHVPTQVPGVPPVVRVSAGIFHSVGVTRDGKVLTWGWNAYGQLGDGTTVDRHVPTVVGSLAPAAAVAGGAFHSLAR